MTRHLFLLLLFYLGTYNLFSQDSSYTKYYYLGSDTITTSTTCFLNCDSAVVFIQLHEDETTSVEASEQYFSNNGGFLVQLKHREERLLKFKVRNQLYTVDPNRIYTAKGLRDNLTSFKSFKPEAVMYAASLAQQLINLYVTDKRLIVALHNNTDNKFSILSYKKGMPEALNASKVFINKDMDPDDFILTTDSSIYRRIKDMNINVVLQSIKAKDDGSLSVYAQQKKIPYINIEAQHEHVAEQNEMLLAIHDIIAGYYNILELNYTTNN